MNVTALRKASFTVVWITGAFLGLVNALRIVIPTWIIRVLGIILLVSIPVLAVTFIWELVKSGREKK